MTNFWTLFAATALFSSGLLAQDGPSREAKEHLERANARNALKHATDPAARHISQKATRTTITAMLGLRRPAVLDNPKVKPGAKRLAPFETHVWFVDARITSVVKREDGDFYFVLDDGKGNQTVAEIPDPKESKGSPFLKQIQASYRFAARVFKPTAQPKTVNVAARITGIGFFGGTKSGAKNGARLDPTLDITFLPAGKKG